MRKIKIHLLFIAVFAISAAYTNKPDKPVTHATTFHTYAFAFYNINFTKIYYCIDLTAEGMILGIDYDCQQPTSVCTFIADITRAHADGTGNWFYVSDIPQSGISYGTFIDFDD
jgi:hypothetical protein